MKKNKLIKLSLAMALLFGVGTANAQEQKVDQQGPAKINRVGTSLNANQPNAEEQKMAESKQNHEVANPAAEMEARKQAKQAQLADRMLQSNDPKDVEKAKAKLEHNNKAQAKEQTPTPTAVSSANGTSVNSDNKANLNADNNNNAAKNDQKDNLRQLNSELAAIVNGAHNYDTAKESAYKVLNNYISAAQKQLDGNTLQEAINQYNQVFEKQMGVLSQKVNTNSNSN